MKTVTGLERVSRWVWVYDPELFTVEHAEAFSCPPDEGYWWVPAVGYSLPASKVFDSEGEAVGAAYSECQKRINAWRRCAEALHRRWQKLAAMPESPAGGTVSSEGAHDAE